MIRALPFIFAIATLAAAPADAQQKCVTPAGACALSSGTPGSSCACFTAHGAVQGKIESGTPPEAAHYCCTSAGKIGPLPNFAKQVGQVCSATPPSHVPANGVACN